MPDTLIIEKKTSVWLRKDLHKPHLLHCPTCTKPLIKYQGTIAMIVPGDVTEEDETSDIMKAPFEIICRGKSDKYGKCPAVYIIEGFVEG